MSSGLLDLDGTEKTEKVGHHESVSKFGLVIDAVNFSTVLGKSSEGDNVVEIDVEGSVDVVDKGFGILARSYRQPYPNYDSPPLNGTTTSLEPLEPSSWKMPL